MSTLLAVCWIPVSSTRLQRVRKRCVMRRGGSVTAALQHRQQCREEEGFAEQTPGSAMSTSARTAVAAVLGDDCQHLLLSTGWACASFMFAGDLQQPAQPECGFLALCVRSLSSVKGVRCSVSGKF
jgi:hypothetical protein